MSTPIELSATAFCECAQTEPLTTSLTLGDDLRVDNEACSLAIDRSAVFDVKIGSSPRAATEFFTGTVLTIGFELDGRREVLFVDGSRRSIEKYAGLLYRWLLDDTEVAIRHPAEVGGRVTGETFDIGTLRVTPGKVGCTGITYPFGVNLDRIVHLSQSEGELLGDRRTMVSVQYVKDGRAVTLELSLDPPRKQHLLGRHLRQEYDEIRRSVRTLDLPTVAVQALYKLYSLRGTATPSTLFDGSPTESLAVLRGLSRADLVRLSDGEVELTSRGWILVTEHVDTTASHESVTSD
ncbi:CheF family chemotaxis protein [Haloplanus aerogenes]|uniref:Helix-turn-helix protein n=1 Tax=Haloplanus aerogenes TaxID=660522 RepID=A0A3M0DTN1_9EURY|nr:CheF family chemotaxis protein [Haloplanus aerogenes]AZH25583.1 hypothetical protein DU502_09395 [Haloplanus aerogenes]RMB25302.1 helix-turn-helix protein [Haloplanus aerogenes]